MRLFEFLNENKYIPDNLTTEIDGIEYEVHTQIEEFKVEDKETKNARGEIVLRHYFYPEEGKGAKLPLGNSELHMSYDERHGWVVGKIHVAKEVRGQGIAISMLKMAISKTEETLTTTGVISDMGKDLLKALVRKGFADQKDDNYIIHMGRKY